APGCEEKQLQSPELLLHRRGDENDNTSLGGNGEMCVCFQSGEVLINCKSSGVKQTPVTRCYGDGNETSDGSPDKLLLQRKSPPLSFSLPPYAWELSVQSSVLLQRLTTRILNKQRLSKVPTQDEEKWKTHSASDMAAAP
ncbi:Phosphonates import ATP-binding protein PhnC 1, partial [Dissostichus eleginoides]